MCGINGIFSFGASAPPPDREELLRTRDAMIARGPDGYGEWWSANGRLALAHRRLSILDLSDRAAQPMLSQDEALCITYNGEIYNTPQLRNELEKGGYKFRTRSDTEVLLHLYHRDGEKMLSKIRGMFALAIWDNRDQSLFLARDPYGIKPLYYAKSGGILRFASQVKALLAGKKISRQIDPAGLVGFHIWGSVPDPFTLYSSVQALPAGHCLRLDNTGQVRLTSYCSIAELCTKSVEDAEGGTSQSTEQRIGEAVKDSVNAHLLSDVEVGVFLSAGIDSGALLGLMRDAGNKRATAITLSFDEFRGTPQDEAPLASEIAQTYGAKHIIHRVTPEQFRRSIPSIIEAMDQPSIDGVNSWLVAKAASEAGLKVALSGVGGDELLAGYNSFRQIPKMVSALRFPSAIPGMAPASRALLGLSGQLQKRPKLRGLMEYGGTYAGAYLLHRSVYLPSELETLVGRDVLEEGLARLALPQTIVDCLSPEPDSPIAKVAVMEKSYYMRNQLLRDADWAGMAHSLEIRTPLVDWQLLKAVSPAMPNMTAARGKRALAGLPNHPLPRKLVERDKSGFGLPASFWQRAGEKGRAPNNGMVSRHWGKEVLEHFIA